VRDIAAVAAVALTEAGHEGATYTLTGPEAITHSQIAVALTAALARTVRFIDVTPEAFADSIRELLPPWQVDGLLEDYAHYRRGEAAKQQRYRQLSPRSPARRPAASSSSHATTPQRSPAEPGVSRPHKEFPAHLGEDTDRADQRELRHRHRPVAPDSSTNTNRRSWLFAADSRRSDAGASSR
jgi:hypothetical protein